MDQPTSARNWSVYIMLTERKLEGRTDNPLVIKVHAKDIPRTTWLSLFHELYQQGIDIQMEKRKTGTWYAIACTMSPLTP